MTIIKIVFTNYVKSQSVPHMVMDSLTTEQHILVMKIYYEDANFALVFVDMTVIQSQS